MELVGANAPSVLRAAREGEAGLTLAELAVSLAIFAILAGSIFGALLIGFRVVGSSGDQARFAGSHDVLAVEQQVGADVARAVCLASPAVTGPTSSIPETGGVSGCHGLTCTSGYSLCLAWFQPGSTVCHTVSYIQTQDANGHPFLQRQDIAGGVKTAARITTGDVNLTVTWPSAAVTSTNGYVWTTTVAFKVTQTGLGAPNVAPVAATFGGAPLAMDPLSPVPGGATPPGTFPC